MQNSAEVPLLRVAAVSSDDNKLTIWRLEGPDLVKIGVYDAEKFVTDVSWCSSTGI